MTVDEAFALYQRVFNEPAESRDAAEWAEIGDEVLRVIAAPTLDDAAAEVGWWTSWNSGEKDARVLRRAAGIEDPLTCTHCNGTGVEPGGEAA